VVGDNNTVNGFGNANWGDNINVVGSDNIVAKSANASGSAVFGNASTIDGTNGIAFGNSVTLSGQTGIAIGQTSSVTGDKAIAIGRHATASDTVDIALGDDATASGGDSIASGASATASGASSSAYGANSRATGTSSVAIGDALASKDDAIAIGAQAQATEVDSIALGFGAAATGVNSIAIGHGASATGSVAMGNGASAANGGAAYGDGATATASLATAIGPNASATGANSVAIGSNSVATAANTVSFGSPGHERTLTNVAPGLLSPTSTQAVNGSQLYATNQVANTALALGQNSVQYDNAAHSSVTLNPGGPAAGLHNVAAGIAPTDAVNVSQMNLFSNKANAGIAASVAMGEIPQAYTKGDGLLGVGFGTYQGQTAFAFGASKLLDDGHTILKANAGVSTSGQNTVGAGIGWQF